MATPFYVVLLRREDVDLELGSPVYFSPNHIKVVCKELLVQERGIDADVDADADAPKYFSDDEEEQRYKSGLEAGEIDE